MTDAKGGISPGFQPNWKAAEIQIDSGEEWLWLAQWLENHRPSTRHSQVRLFIAAHACREMHKRESSHD